MPTSRKTVIITMRFLVPKLGEKNQEKPKKKVLKLSQCKCSSLEKDYFQLKFRENVDLPSIPLLKSRLWTHTLTSTF